MSKESERKAQVAKHRRTERDREGHATSKMVASDPAANIVSPPDSLAPPTPSASSHTIVRGESPAIIPLAPKMSEEGRRSNFITWGVGLLTIFLAWLFGSILGRPGAVGAACFGMFGVALLLRGHFPGWFNSPWMRVKAWGGMAAVIFISGVTVWLGFPAPPLQPSVSAESTSEIVALIHSRARVLPSGSTEVYSPQFRDLFHDWIIKLVPRGLARGVTVVIRDQRQPKDQIRVTPPGSAVISGTKPGWISGFDEPTHAPDFFTRTVEFAVLGEPTTITIRRPINPRNQTTNVISTMELDLDRVVKVSAHCIVTRLDPAKLDVWFNRLSDQLRTLALWQGANGPAPTRMNPDDPFPPLSDKQSELINEVRCQDTPCKHLLITMVEHGNW